MRIKQLLVFSMMDANTIKFSFYFSLYVLLLKLNYHRFNTTIVLCTALTMLCNIKGAMISRIDYCGMHF